MSADATLRIGFLPLLDAAIPIVAARCGFAARRSLALDLVRETSWANVRDRLAVGHFDAAHLLAPMPVAAALGLTPLDSPVIAPMALGVGGNAVTVSAELWSLMRAHGGSALLDDPAAAGAALKSTIDARGRRPSFAVVHPYSAHNYELRYWLAASGVRPDEEVEIGVLPPPLMPDALAAQHIDGFCVGEPWNTIAARRAGGVVILPTSAVWRTSPEKVLGLRADWTLNGDETLERLLHAMLDAADWCADPANRSDLVRLLAAPDLLNVEPDVLLPALDGRLSSEGPFIAFTSGFANFPWRSHAEWFLRQMERWGQAVGSPGALERARASYRPDILRGVLTKRGVSTPLSDDRPESAGASETLVPGTLGDVRLPSVGFFDV